MSVELLKHELERFGVVTVMDVTLFDIDSKVPVLFLDTLKISNITAEGQEKTITGGKYADLLLTYNFGRSMNLEFQDALLSPVSMKQLWGAQQSATTSAHHYATATAVAADETAGTISIQAKNLAGTNITADLTILSAVNLTTGKVCTFGTPASGVVVVADSEIAEGDVVRLDYKYVVAAGNNVAELVLTSSSFPKTVKLVGKTFVLNQENGNQVAFEIEVPKLKLASNFSMTLDAEGDASVFDFSGMALISGAEKELIRFKLLG